MIGATYLIQGLCSGAVILGVVAGYYAFEAGEYFLFIVDIATIPINIFNVISPYYARKRLRQVRGPIFSRRTQCSCGACDWGTLIRQYDEVPVCRNCWRTWKGK